MIYTIGYQKRTITEIVNIMDAKDIGLLVDVRSVPYSRHPSKHEFNRNRLLPLLSSRYLWLGDICGGKQGPVTDNCIDRLEKYVGQTTIMLMCMENHPCDCHRLCDIARRLRTRGHEAVHLFDGHEATTDELTEEACNERKTQTR